MGAECSAKTDAIVCRVDGIVDYLLWTVGKAVPQNEALAGVCLLRFREGKAFDLNNDRGIPHCINLGSSSPPRSLPSA